MGKKKVILADDEELICSLLKSIIKWDELELELVDIVHTGKALYDSIHRNKPDIVVADICMPEMDGIELIRSIREEGTPCKFIIVSGYRQFEYARKAVKYDVEDYILKPVDDEELNAALRKLAGTIEGKPNGSRELSETVEQAHKQLGQYFLEKTIYELAGMDASLQTIREKYGVDLQPGLFRMLWIKLDIANPDEQESAKHIAPLQRKLAEVLENLLRDHCSQILFDVSDNRIRAGINYRHEQESAMDSVMHQCFEHLKHIADLFIGMSVTLGVGCAYPQAGQWAKSDEQACRAIRNRMVKGVDRVIQYNPAEEQTVIPADLRNSVIAQSTADFEILDAAGFERHVDQLFSEMSGKYSCWDLVDLLQVIARSFYSSQAISDGFANPEGSYRALQAGMESSATLQQLRDAFATPIVNALKALAQEIASKNAKPVRQAIAFIDEHYASSIGLEEVADTVGLNPVYLSNIFKKETGQNFTEYLANRRMEAAKDLLRESNKNVNEIANCVGFSDARYFSKLFKKMVGIKPTDYRRICG